VHALQPTNVQAACDRAGFDPERKQLRARESRPLSLGDRSDSLLRRRSGGDLYPPTVEKLHRPRREMFAVRSFTAAGCRHDGSLAGIGPSG
jgi:hypothetical protein